MAYIPSSSHLSPSVSGCNVRTKKQHFLLNCCQLLCAISLREVVRTVSPALLLKFEVWDLKALARTHMLLSTLRSG